MLDLTNANMGVAISVLGLLQSPADAHAGLSGQPVDLGEPASLRANASQLFQIATDLAQRGRTKQAKDLLELLAQDPNPDVRNEARYRWSLLLIAEGSGRKAAVLLRQILDEKPKAAPVRLQLASLLQKFGDEEGALRALRAVRASDLPPNVARFVDRLSASLQATKKFGFQFEVAVAPDSNINRATRSETLATVIGDFTFDEDSQAKSGIGAALRGMAHARLAVGDKVDIDTRVSGDANLYRRKDFNDISLDVATGPEWRLGAIRMAGEAGVTRQWYGMSPYQRSFRLAGSIVKPLDPVSQLRLDAGARWTNNLLNDLQDGRGWSLRGRYERAFSPRLSIVASLATDRFKAEDPAYSTRAWGTGLTAYRELGRMTLSVGAEVGLLKADDRLQILPQVRKDRSMRMHLGVVYRQLMVAGFAPMTRLVIERNKSAVEFYDYQRIRTEFGVTRAF